MCILSGIWKDFNAMLLHLFFFNTATALLPSMKGSGNNQSKQIVTYNSGFLVKCSNDNNPSWRGWVGQFDMYCLCQTTPSPPLSFHAYCNKQNRN